MIRRWVILGFLCLVVAILLKDLYKEAIMYNPLQGIEAKGREAVSNGKELSPVFETGWGKEIAENNLFSPTRSPVQPKPPPQFQMKPVEPPKRPDMNLKGVVCDQLGDFIAYIEKDRAKAVPVRKGDSLDDVEVIDIKEKSVELRWNEETISLSLEKVKTIKRPSATH